MRRRNEGCTALVAGRTSLWKYPLPSGLYVQPKFNFKLRLTNYFWTGHHKERTQFLRMTPSVPELYIVVGSFPPSFAPSILPRVLICVLPFFLSRFKSGRRQDFMQQNHRMAAKGRIAMLPLFPKMPPRYLARNTIGKESRRIQNCGQGRIQNWGSAPRVFR